MADFRQIRAALDAKGSAERTVSREREQERRYREKLDRLKRSFSENFSEIRELEAKVASAARRYRAAKSEFSERREVVDRLWEAIEARTDPEENIGNWGSDTPILLFPYRLETRFKKVRDQAGTTDELWLRIYPDDCLINTFEEDLTEMERQNARRYWAYDWAATGKTVQKKEAWKELVTAHGSGRAGWIIEQYQPLNPAEQPPTTDDDGTFFLTIPAQENEPLGADAIAVANFWKAVFLQEETALNASELAKKYPPANLRESLPEGAEVEVTFVRFPAFGDEDSKPFSWSEAPKVHLLPERFVFLGYNKTKEGWSLVRKAITPRAVQAPLTVGPNPTAEEADQFQETEDGDLIVPEEMRWMTDFEVAMEKGMAMRIPLSAVEAEAGFDRVFVVGLRLGSDPDEAKEELETLIKQHLYGRSGFAIIPQGTPTNNTDDGPSGFSRTDDPEESYPVFVEKNKLFDTTDKAEDKVDGQWLAEWLGLDPDIFQQVPNADQTDQAEARAMNLALWPGTMGYWMQRMMDPVFRNPQTVRKTKDFFTNFVRGRGHIPSVRIGRQPYGILQASAYRNLEEFQVVRVGASAEISSNQIDTFLPGLYATLMHLDGFWQAMSNRVSYVAKDVDDPQQQLLDIVGLHAGSAEYYARLGHGRMFLHNYFTFAGLGVEQLFNNLQFDLVSVAKSILSTLGYHGKVEPKIFEKYYHSGQNRLNGPIVDDRPVSETELIRPYTESGQNYIGWLIDAIGDYEGVLHPQKGFLQRPSALLYKLLRHALLEAFGNAGQRARFEAELITRSDFELALAREPEFIHVETANATSESRIAHLLEVDARISDNQKPLAQYLGDVVKERVPPIQATREIKRMESALGKLEKVPTARLERLLAEHVDICTYRHDAWVQGLLSLQLERLRKPNPETTQQGLYLGGYAWLENLRPEHKTANPVRLDRELAAIFQREGDIPLTSDTTNQGYIHAPSLNHAVTAAVLRNGYLSDATPQQPDLLAVNLSSERVRLALEVLEGIRNGQSLGALLGYRFERKLHDEDPQLFVYTYQLRRKFQLVANQLAATADPDEEAQEAIAARNVVDGYKLLKAALGNDHQLDFAFLNPILQDPEPSPAERTFIEASIRELQDIHDALSDLGIAESVHQIVQGNYERAAATLDSFSNATFPQVPDVVVTPRSGIGLTHRVGIQFNSNQLPDAGHTPRGRAEPSLNAWLTDRLPSFSEVGVKISYQNPGEPLPALTEDLVTLQQIGLQPIDLIYLSDFGTTQALSALDERILQLMFARPGVHANAIVTIEYTSPVPDPAINTTIFELAPLLRSLRSVVLTSRPLLPTDVQPPGEASTQQKTPMVLTATRISGNLPDLTQLNDRITEWQGAFPTVDQQLSDFVEAMSVLGQYGFTEAGFGFVFSSRQGIFRRILDKLGDYLAGWSRKQAEFDLIMSTELPAAVDDTARIAILRRAEALVSTTYLTLADPPDAVQFQTDIETKGLAFAAKKTSLQLLAEHPPARLSQLMTDLNAQLPLTDFDANDLDLIPEENAIANFQQELLDKALALKLEVETRIGMVTTKLAQHNEPAATAEQKLKLLQDAGKVLFGEDFLMVPHFQLPETQALEWQNSLLAQTDLLAFQRQTDAFPVDTWLHGNARVREKMHQVENAFLLSEAFGQSMGDLLPTQFPYRKWVPDPAGAPLAEAAEPWLALEYPAHFEPDEEKILYTATYAENFNPFSPQCGLLVDEWTEVIPTREETTGLTFHYDRPNTEAPQSWLLATPSRQNGEWEWDDLIEALHQTLDLAKQRAVEPAHVEDTALGVFSPATVFPVAPWSITASLNLSGVNVAPMTF